MRASVEERHGNLWGVATLKLREPLDRSEVVSVKRFWNYQMSDYFGEILEWTPVTTEYGELFVSFWSPGRHYFINTEPEFERRINAVHIRAQAALNTQDGKDAHSKRRDGRPSRTTR